MAAVSGAEGPSPTPSRAAVFRSAATCFGDVRRVRDGGVGSRGGAYENDEADRCARDAALATGCGVSIGRRSRRTPLSSPRPPEPDRTNRRRIRRPAASTLELVPDGGVLSTIGPSAHGPIVERHRRPSRFRAWTAAGDGSDFDSFRSGRRAWRRKRVRRDVARSHHSRSPAPASRAHRSAHHSHTPPPRNPLPRRALYVRRRTSTADRNTRGARASGRPFGARKLLPCRPHNRFDNVHHVPTVSVRPTEKEFQMFSSVGDFFTLILNLGFSAALPVSRSRFRGGYRLRRNRYGSISVPRTNLSGHSAAPGSHELAVTALLAAAPDRPQHPLTRT